MCIAEIGYEELIEFLFFFSFFFFFRDMSEVGMNLEFEGTPPYVMEETLKYLNTKYGSIPK